MEASDGKVSRVTFDGVFEKTLLALESKNSVLRSGDNMQLMTRIMVNSTQEYLDIAAIYECAIQRIDWLLDTPGNPDKDSLICKIGDAKLELGTLLRLVEPFAEHVVSHLTHLPAQHEIVKFQIKLIDNNVHTFVPKCKALIQQCESLTDSYNRKSSAKMNNILNILTLITFVITPLQLLTGLYGMNFRIMPELHWHHGYAYFWVVSITLSLLSALLLYRCTQEE
jgi:magnesium transporter